MELTERRLTRLEYQQVRVFCKRYPEMKSQAAQLLGVGAQSYDPMPHGKGIPSDPVSAAAMRRLKLLENVSMIDNAALAIDGGRWARALILNACYGVSWEKLPAETMRTSHKQAFFTVRRAFFTLLWERWNT
jgi:hypothetical protein